MTSRVLELDEIRETMIENMRGNKVVDIREAFLSNKIEILIDAIERYEEVISTSHISVLEGCLKDITERLLEYADKGIRILFKNADVIGQDLEEDYRDYWISEMGRLEEEVSIHDLIEDMDLEDLQGCMYHCCTAYNILVASIIDNLDDYDYALEEIDGVTQMVVGITLLTITCILSISTRRR